MFDFSKSGIYIFFGTEGVLTKHLTEPKKTKRPTEQNTAAIQNQKQNRSRHFPGDTGRRVRRRQNFFFSLRSQRLLAPRTRKGRSTKLPRVHKEKNGGSFQCSIAQRPFVLVEFLASGQSCWPPRLEQSGSGSASGGCIASVPAAPERCQHLTPSGGEETNLLLFAAYLYPFPCVATTPPRTRLPLSAHHRGLAT